MWPSKYLGATGKGQGYVTAKMPLLAQGGEQKHCGPG